MNPLNLIDFYKADHRRQYPPNTTLIYSNFTPRSSRIPEIQEIVFFGLQYVIKEYLVDTFNHGFFSKPKNDIIRHYKNRMDTSLGADAVPTEHMEQLHDLGYLPIEIKALEEGSIVPLGVPVLTIRNTRPEFFWLTNYLETLISCVLWKPCTSATLARQYKKIFNKYADETVGDRLFTQWQGHDFSFRGMSGVESALISGAGHLLSFTGTDTVAALDFVEEYYCADAKKELLGGSVPATEHSVMSLGSQESELNTFRRLIKDVYPKGIVSIVSDTWDFWKVITEYVPILKSDILAREGKTVLRPDSGDPVKIVCGDANAVAGSPEYKGAIQCLWETFGGTVTAKGFRQLDSHIGLIYGDSITLERQLAILEGLKQKGFASSNVVLGIGSYTYQYTTRDVFGFAMKATYGKIGDVPYEIFKNPKTDSGSGVNKKSAKGLLAVFKDVTGNFVLKEQVTETQEASPEGCLRSVFRDGKLLKEQAFAQIRQLLQTREL